MKYLEMKLIMTELKQGISADSSCHCWMQLSGTVARHAHARYAQVRHTSAMPVNSKLI